MTEMIENRFFQIYSTIVIHHQSSRYNLQESDRLSVSLYTKKVVIDCWFHLPLGMK